VWRARRASVVSAAPAAVLGNRDLGDDASLPRTGGDHAVIRPGVLVPATLAAMLAWAAVSCERQAGLRPTGRLLTHLRTVATRALTG
jgi:hypothetical protein